MGNGDWEPRLRQGLDDLARAAEPPPTLADRINERLLAPPRSTPPIALWAVAAAIVVVAGTLAIVTATHHGRRNVVAVGPGATTTSIPAPTTPTFGVPTTPITTPTTPPATTEPTSPPSTSSPSTSVTSSPTTTGSTTTAPGSPACAPGDLRTETLADAPTYPSGQTVTITVKVTNVSRSQCQIADPYPHTFASTIQITAADGTTVWDPGASVAGIFAIPVPKVLPPGGSYLWTTAQWDQKTCTAPACKAGPTTNQGPPVPPGKYTAAPATGLAPPSTPTPVTFTITA
jgi:hypothetical protein